MERLDPDPSERVQKLETTVRRCLQRLLPSSFRYTIKSYPMKKGFREVEVNLGISLVAGDRQVSDPPAILCTLKELLRTSQSRWIRQEPELMDCLRDIDEFFRAGTILKVSTERATYSYQLTDEVEVYISEDQGPLNFITNWYWFGLEINQRGRDATR